MKRLFLIFLSLSWTVMLVAQSNIAFLELPDRKVPAPQNKLTVAGASDFLLIKNFCLIPARVDGQTGYLILDTGAPGLVLNRAPEQGTAQAGVSCTQSLEVGTTQVRELNWAGRSEKNLEAYTLAMPHLSRSTGKDILGLIGYDLLRDFEILLDYQQNRLLIFPAYRNELHQGSSPQQELDFSLYEHLPVFEINLQGKKYRIGFDTGAASNLISKTLSKVLDQQLSYLKQEELLGLDGMVQIVDKVAISDLSVGGQKIPDMTYLVQDLDHLSLSSDWSLDGLLGAPILHKWTTSINFPKQKLYIWEKK